MTAKGYITRPGICTIPGCGLPRHVSKHGRVDTRCDKHCRERNKQVAHKKVISAPVDVPESVPARHAAEPTPGTIKVMVIDYQSQHLFHVVGTVDCTEEFPPTEGDLKRVIALASRQGIYIAYIRAYKNEDIHESN